MFADLVMKTHYENKKQILHRGYLGIFHIFNHLLRVITSRVLTTFIPLPSGDKFGQNGWTGTIQDIDHDVQPG